MKTRGWKTEDARWNTRSVLECGGPPPLSDRAAFREVSPSASRRRAGAALWRAAQTGGLAQSKIWPLCVATLTFVALAAVAMAQSYSIDWSTIDGGGGTSTGGVYAVSGVLGQPDAGRMTGGNFTLEGGFWGILAAIQTPGAPLLSTEVTNGWVKISWPAPAPNWVLTETNRITGTASPLWPEVSATQYQTNGGCIYILTTPQPMQNRFYRLHKP